MRWTEKLQWKLSIGSSLGEIKCIAYVGVGKDVDIYQYVSMELSIVDLLQTIANFAIILSYSCSAPQNL